MFWEKNRPPSTVDQDSEAETITSFEAENFHRETLENELNKLQLKNLELESRYKAAKFELKNCRTQINEPESKQCIRCKDLEAKLKESKALIGQYEIRNEQVEKDLQRSRSQNSKLPNEKDELISGRETLTISRTVPQYVEEMNPYDFRMLLPYVLPGMRRYARNFDTQN